MSWKKKIKKNPKKTNAKVMRTLIHNKNISLLANFQGSKDCILEKALKPNLDPIFRVGPVSVSISVSTHCIIFPLKRGDYWTREDRTCPPYEFSFFLTYKNLIDHLDYIGFIKKNTSPLICKITSFVLRLKTF